MLNGLTNNLPEDVLFGLGVLYKGAVKVGVTVGPPQWDPGKQTRNTAFDGKLVDVEGLDQVTGWKPKLSFTLIEFGPAASGKQIKLVEGGATEGVAEVDGTIPITMPDAGEFLAAGEYQDDIRVVFRRGTPGEYFAIHLPSAYCAKYSIESRTEEEALVKVELEPRLSQADAIATPGKCPFRYELRTALPAA